MPTEYAYRRRQWPGRIVVYGRPKSERNFHYLNVGVGPPAGSEYRAVQQQACEGSHKRSVIS